MPSPWFEVVSLALRYWYALLAVLFVFQALRLLRYDHATQRRRQQRLPDAGCIGEFIILESTEELEAGLSLAAVREGTLGRLRTADVVVPAPGVAPNHADLHFLPFVGLLVRPRRSCSVTVDGYEITNEIEAKAHPMQHNSVLQVGEIALRLQVFAGIDLPQSPLVRSETPAAQQEPAAPPEPTPAPTEPEIPPAAPIDSTPEQREEPQAVTAPQPIAAPDPLASAYQPTRPLVSADPSNAASSAHRRTRRRYGE